MYKRKRIRNKIIRQLTCVLIAGICVSCGLISEKIVHIKGSRNPSSLSLGIIGLDHRKSQFADFRMIDNAPLGEAVQVFWEEIPVDKEIYKRYIHLDRDNSYGLYRKDSIHGTSTIIKLEVGDIPAYIYSINQSEKLIEYLSRNKNVKGVTTAYMVFPKEIMTQIRESALLQMNFDQRLHINVLESVSKQGRHSILFSQGLVIGYESSYLCCEFDAKNRLQVVGVSSRGPCYGKLPQTDLKAKINKAVRL